MNAAPPPDTLPWCAACNAYVLSPLLWNCADLQRKCNFGLESAGWAAVNATLALFRDIEPPDNRMCAFCWRDLVSKLERSDRSERSAAVLGVRERIVRHRLLRDTGRAA